MSMNKNIITIALICVGVLLLAYNVLRFNAPSGTSQQQDTTTGKGGAFTFERTEIDLGIVRQSEEPRTVEFPFVYEGTERLVITGTPTSCGCTTASIDVTELTPGAKGTLNVTFDPNLHAEPEGRFYKTVTLLTEPPLPVLPEVRIWAQVDLDLGPEHYKEGDHHEGLEAIENENLDPGRPYRTISAATLKEALEDKHFFLVDVHVPEQAHILGTDAVIPYDEIAARAHELPDDKSAKIVLYCRSGSMSQQAAQTLVDMGYADVTHVEGGINAFNTLR